jgi:hypothetical protein
MVSCKDFLNYEYKFETFEGFLLYGDLRFQPIFLVP